MNQGYIVPPILMRQTPSTSPPNFSETQSPFEPWFRASYTSHPYTDPLERLQTLVMKRDGNWNPLVAKNPQERERRQEETIPLELPKFAAKVYFVFYTCSEKLRLSSQSCQSASFATLFLKSCHFQDGAAAAYLLHCACIETDTNCGEVHGSCIGVSFRRCTSSALAQFVFAARPAGAAV